MRPMVVFDRHTPLAATRFGAGLRWLAWVAAAILLLAPAVAMQFTAEVDWGAEDFVFAAVMLVGACAVLELLLRRPADAWFAGAFLLALATGFVLLWGNLAVGLIGGEQHPANALYLAVVAVGAGGVLLARLRPLGMAWAMAATALAQALVAVAALALWPLDAAPVLAVNGAFVAAWTAAAVGFSRALREPARTPSS